MPPCFPRQYDANPSISGATLLTNRENPNSATLTFTIPTLLTLNNGGDLRTPTTVNDLAYTVEWAAEGFSSPSYSGSFSGTVDIVNTSLQRTATGRAGVSGILNQVTTPGFTVPANLQAGDRICFTVRVPESIGRVKVGGEIWPPGSTPEPVTGCTLTVVDQPYTRFYGADISAGGGFNTANGGLGSCSENPTAPPARAFGPMRTDILAGTGSQLAVFALGAIQGIQPLSRSDRTPTELAFSNASASYVTGGPNRNFGGNFGSLLCAHNHFDDAPDNTPGNTSWVDNVPGIADDIDLANPAVFDTDRHYINGDINLYGQLPEDLVAGKRTVIYVDGNVSVRANQDASGSGRVGFGISEWASIDLVPSLTVIARGNIYIDDGVTELDGSYISQGGQISTCSVDATFPIDLPTVPQRTTECRTQLRINGAFIADTVNLLRTFGSLRESYAGEVPFPDPTPADPAPTIPPTTRAAETFIYNPTIWFTNGGGLPSNSKIQIDSYISLPPSL